MDKKTGKNRKRTAAIIIASVMLFLFGITFSVDLIRAKRYVLPPVFCYPAVIYEHGSVDYYGFLYKVWKDYDPFEKTVSYYVGFWFIPKFWSI